MSDSVKHTKLNVYDFFLSTTVRKTYTNLGVSLILIIILIFFALMPTIKTIDVIKEKISAYETINKKLDTKIKSAKNLNDQMTLDSTKSPKGLKSEIEFLNKVFFFDTSFTELYENLHRRADENHVAITSFTPKYQSETSNSQKSFENSPVSPSSSFYELNLNIESKNITDVENFLSQLEGHKNFPIFSRIKNVSIKDNIDTLAETGDERIITANITMVIYLDSSRSKTQVKTNI